MWKEREAEPMALKIHGMLCWNAVQMRKRLQTEIQNTSTANAA
jgi:hypothetical protein